MNTFKIRDLINDTPPPLREYTRDDGTSFLTSPSLRTVQMAARSRQADAVGDTIIDPDAWRPYTGTCPASGYHARWLDDHGWVVITHNIHAPKHGPAQPCMASLPDLPAAIDHPVFERNPEREDSPFVAGGNRSYRDRYFSIDPIGLGIGTGIFFHTRDFGSYRDGGSWSIKDATLVYDTKYAKPEERKTNFMWGRDGEVERHAVQVVSQVEWMPDPSRKASDCGKPVIISHREPLVRFRATGKMQRLRLAALQGQLAAIVYRLVDVGPGGSEEPNEREIQFFNMLVPKHEQLLAKAAAALDGVPDPGPTELD
jgi:hypothetical protein